MTADFVRVARRGEVPDPGRLSFELDDQMLVLLHVAGEFFCLDDICTHDGGPLGDGELVEHRIACPRHGAEFDIRTGAALSMPATEATRVHQVRLEGDDILVRLSED